MSLFKSKKTNTVTSTGKTILLSKNSPFAMQEAYKTLRTNLILSLPDEKSKKIVITSSLPSEGKSTTAINLAYAFAQNKSKVLLIECDLRKPNNVIKLGLKVKPGLSNLLVGMVAVDQAIQHLPNGLDFIPAGDIPPNPTELLGSAQMSRFLERLGDYYEFILLDCPPLSSNLSDVSILAPFTSGTIIVTRQNIATRESVNEAVKKLRFANAKILGFAFNGVKNDKSRHYGYKKYGRYGYERYGYGYSRKERS